MSDTVPTVITAEPGLKANLKQSLRELEQKISETEEAMNQAYSRVRNWPKARELGEMYSCLWQAASHLEDAIDKVEEAGL